MDAKLEELVRK